MEVNHTAGPWHVHDGDNRFLFVDSQTEGSVCKIAVNGHSEANAHLIAAAPELLEVLVAYKFHHKLLLQVTSDVDCPCKICQMADAVIRKAKGE